MPEPTVYRYIGEGRWYPCVPPRDLTASDIAAIEALHPGVCAEALQSGIYESIEAPAVPGEEG